MFGLLDPKIIFPDLGWVIAGLMLAGIIVRGVFNMATTRFAHFKHLDKAKIDLQENLDEAAEGISKTYVRQDICGKIQEIVTGKIDTVDAKVVALDVRIENGFIHINKKLDTIIRNGNNK